MASVFAWWHYVVRVVTTSKRRFALSWRGSSCFRSRSIKFFIRSFVHNSQGRWLPPADMMTACSSCDIIDDEDHNSDYWCRAEIIRIRGDIHAMRGETGPAEEFLTASMAHARQQGALGWELRSANSLARFYMDRQEPTMAHATLAPVFSRFTEGFSTRDLLEARSLLAGMRVG